jgi:hypothetical protein
MGKLTFIHIVSNSSVTLRYRGVMTPPIDMITSDGYDLQFGTNVLGMLPYANVDGLGNANLLTDIRTLLLHEIAPTCSHKWR